MNPTLKAGVVALAAASLVACSGTRNAGGLVPSIPGGGAPSVASASQNVVADVPSGAVSYHDYGAAKAGEPLDVAVTLRYQNEARLQRLVAEQQTPGSPRYRRWLTNAEFNDMFAPSQQTYARVVRSLRRAGLRVVRTYENRTVVDVSGTVGVMERYFDTKIHAVDQTGYGKRLVNVRRAVAPPELADALLSVDGLSTLSVVHSGIATYAPHSTGRRAGSKRSGALFGPTSLATGIPGYAPLAFQRAYDMPVTHAGAGGPYDGRGRTGGIVIDADFADGDIAAYLKQFGIERTGKIVRELVDGGPPPNNAALDTVEATLDVETIASVAPGAKVVVYEIPKLALNDITDAYNKVVGDGTVDAVNSSFGGCETLFAASARGWSAIAAQGLAKGMTFSASTGDHGGLLCASAPASSPNVVAVGGTALEIGVAGDWVNEVSWSGSGGGVSTVFGVPGWQASYAGINARGRNVPDVALDGDPVTGIAFYAAALSGWNTGYNPIGGTSLSSPLYVAGVLQIDQLKKSRVGLGSQNIFNTISADGYGTTAPYFHDVVQGSNGPYFAQPGFDLVTGVGSIDFWNLATLL